MASWIQLHWENLAVGSSGSGSSCSCWRSEAHQMASLPSEAPGSGLERPDRGLQASAQRPPPARSVSDRGLSEWRLHQAEPHHVLQRPLGPVSALQDGVAINGGLPQIASLTHHREKMPEGIAKVHSWRVCTRPGRDRLGGMASDLDTELGHQRHLQEAVAALSGPEKPRLDSNPDNQSSPAGVRDLQPYISCRRRYVWPKACVQTSFGASTSFLTAITMTIVAVWRTTRDAVRCGGGQERPAEVAVDWKHGSVSIHIHEVRVAFDILPLASSSETGWKREWDWHRWERIGTSCFCLQPPYVWQWAGTADRGAFVEMHLICSDKKHNFNLLVFT